MNKDIIDTFKNVREIEKEIRSDILKSLIHSGTCFVNDFQFEYLLLRDFTYVSRENIFKLNIKFKINSKLHEFIKEITVPFEPILSSSRQDIIEKHVVEAISEITTELFTKPLALEIIGKLRTSNENFITNKTI